jgi:hypothetical protein
MARGTLREDGCSELHATDNPTKASDSKPVSSHLLLLRLLPAIRQ